MSNLTSGATRTARRTTREVLDDHLARRRRKDVEGDLRANYHPDVVCLSLTGVHRGHDGVRRMADELHSLLPHGRYEYRRLLVEEEFGMLLWSGSAEDAEVSDGSDSYVVRDGLIVAQTVHYHVHGSKTRGE